MSGIPQSFQRRTDDLYSLKTRNLVFENVNGTFPVKGAIAYTTNSVGAVGFSTVTTDSSGNLTIPGTTTMGANGGYVIVDGETGDLVAYQNVFINGKLKVNNNAEVNALNLVNVGDTETIVSKLDDRTINGVETLVWENAAGIAEPISGWNAKLIPSTGIFRTVDISGLTGATLIMAQNQNALLTLFQQRGVFLTTLTADPTLAAVFNTSVSVTFIVTNLDVSASITYFVSGNPAKAVTYAELVDGINTVAENILFGYADLSLVASYNALGTTGTFTFTVGADTTLTIVNSTTNGTAQLFLNHIGTSLMTNTPYTTNQASTTVQDFTVVMPATPIAEPTIDSNTITTCTIGIPAFPPTPIAIQSVGVYWCLSGNAFSTSPNAILSAGTTSYTISDLSGGKTYNVALSYRSLYDESPLGPSARFTTQPLGNSVMSSTVNVFSVEVTQDVNWLSTPSYGTTIINYKKQFMSNVKFTVATVFSAIWTDTLGDLTNILQIQSVTMEFYAGASAATTGARFFTGNNPLTNILYSGASSVEPKYGDTVGLGGSITIYPDTGIDILHKIFNADSTGKIDVGKNMVFGWYCTQGGLRNCEMTRINVIYTV